MNINQCAAAVAWYHTRTLRDSLVLLSHDSR